MKLRQFYERDKIWNVGERRLEKVVLYGESRSEKYDRSGTKRMPLSLWCLAVLEAFY